MVRHIVIGAATLALAALTGCSAAASHTTAAERPVTHHTVTPPAAVVPTSNVVPVLPLSADTVLAGNAEPTFGLGKPHMLAILDRGPVTSDASGMASMAVAFRNNSGQAVSHVDITATASIGGKIVATGKSTDTAPAQIRPGQVALAAISFQMKVPTDATFEFGAQGTTADTSAYNTADLKVTQANLVGGTVVGTAVNDNQAAITGPYTVEVYCFARGKLAGVHGDYGSVTANLPHGATTPFRVDLFGAVCSRFEVGVSGYFAG